MASVTLKSKSGLSVYKDLKKFSMSKLDEFRPRAEDVEKVARSLTAAGFTIEARTQVGISFSGPKELFEEEFGTRIEKHVELRGAPGLKSQKVSFFRSSKPLLMSKRIAPFAEEVHLASPAVLFHDAAPAVPNPNYYYLDVLNDVPALLNATAVQAAGITGTGIRISMVDTGFVTRVTEAHASDDSTHVTVDHTVRHVKGVWLSTDPGHTGTNYFTGGSFADNAITLGTPLAGAHVNIEVVYSCLHPHYLARNYNIDDIRAVGGEDVNTDEYGHGTAEAANILAVAPGATFSFVKYGDFPLAGFQSAVQNQNPNIITCSWGVTGPDQNALLLEVANAVANGIVVIFSAGNGHTEAHGVISHPNLISAGGAYPIQGGGLRASNYASSFDSTIYTNPQRHVPDVVGLVGETPRACLIMLPTEPNNYMDSDIAGSGAFPDGDNTAANDGWCACSGTSAAAPQIAGIVALLLQRYPGITPMAVKNILENSARDVQSGSSNSAGPDSAVPGWDPATGFGLVDAQAACSYLHEGVFNAYIRDSVEDSGAEPVVADRLCASPDVIVRSEPVDDPQEELGQTVKHHYDLCDLVEDGQDNYIYLRVQNRGTVQGDCTATVYFTDPGALSDPMNWDKINATPLNIQGLKPGEFRVVGPIVWPDSQVPAGGHYCLIAILDSPGDAAPDLTTVNGVNDFISMVRDKNNVAWKNIDVVDIIPGGASSYGFNMDGPAGSGHHADLKVDLTGFAAGSTVLVKVARRLADTATLDNMAVQDQSQVFTTVKHLGGIGQLKSMHFKSNEKAKVTIYFSIPDNAPDGTYKIITDLYVDGSKVGSYNKVVNVTHFSFVGNRRTQEIHKRGCPWVLKMSPYNKLPLVDLTEAHKRGFDNCAYCIGGSSK